MTSSKNSPTQSNSVMDALIRIKGHMDKAQAEFDQLSDDVKRSALQFHKEGSSLNHCTRWGVTAVDELIEDLGRPMETPVFGYCINLDERGSFLADVLNQDGKVLYEVADGDCMDDESTSIFEDGYMKDKNDLDGLTTYLQSLGVIPRAGKILSMSDFEREEVLREEVLRPRFRA